MLGPLALALGAFLDLLAPPRCISCGEAGRATFCKRCLATLEPALLRDVNGIPVVAGARYAGAAARAVHALKYEGRSDVARPLGRLMADAACARPELRGAWLVPVPLHPTRLAERGYNQSALLAGELGRHTRARVLALALRREQATLRQVGLERARREKNVAGAFVARRPRALAGRDVVLVDDVVTTGATARACASALGRAGARVIAVVCVASTG